MYHEDERGHRPVPVLSEINAQEENPTSYLPLLLRFGSQYGERLLKTIGSDEVFHFLEGATAGCARSTRRLRYAQLKAFYNFIINRCDFEMRNPCSTSLVCRAFKGAKPISRKIPEKELIDELIYNTQSLRDRLMLELQARCGLRIGESLKIKVSDIYERRILLREPKSGKEEPKRRSAGDHLEGDIEAPGSEDDAELSEPGERNRSHPVDGHSARKVK